jgi:tetratricopeptide (TPR) repeat protein
MRIAEARVTLGVVAAREGDLEEALAYGRRAISGDRKSLPSLATASQDLASIMEKKYPNKPEAREYLDQLRAIREPS